MTPSLTIKNIFSALLMTTILAAPLYSQSRENPNQEELEAREKVIQDIVAESYGRETIFTNRFNYNSLHKRVYRGRRDDRGRIRLERSDEAQLSQIMNLRTLPESERNRFINSRSMAIAGLSAGGILYFLPGQNIFFWETKEEELPEGSVRDGVLTNPVVGGILSSALASAQKELKNNNNKFMGSSKLGNMLMMVLNPAEGFAQSFNAAYGERVFTNGSTEISTISPMPSDSRAAESDRPTNYVGLHFQIRF